MNFQYQKKTWSGTLIQELKHPHKKLINLDNLKAGTYLGKYPTIVKDTVDMVRKKFAG